jgi:hypothetical protein
VDDYQKKLPNLKVLIVHYTGIDEDEVTTDISNAKMVNFVITSFTEFKLDIVR